VPPTQLALAKILQAYTRMSNDEVIEVTTMDRRWGAFGARQLRAALDSSLLWGAGRAEDSYNRLGHALRKAMGVIARQQGRELPAVVNEVGASLVRGSSLKAVLDLDWDEPTAWQQALTIVLDALNAVDHWLATQPASAEAAPEVAASMAAAHQVRDQDVILIPDGTPTLRQGVAEDRRISVEDGEMRHGRKSRSLLIWLQTPCVARSGQ
jgi:hypothetical protein